ncbi:MAG: hypothetical protein KGI80_00815 [Verrucomicrobiota bacterium]|nr:hypothetical protein [Verrucomicrobiota bacterium]
MKITIAEKLRPFSHIPGITAIIPGTDCFIRAFPTLILLVRGTEEIALRLSLTGPVENFTLQLDLEARVLRVFGKASEGFFRLRFSGTSKGVELFGEKVPSQGIIVQGRTLLHKEHLFFPLDLSFSAPLRLERLSLGLHREQEWEKVMHRFDVAEILPFLFTLGQQTPWRKEPKRLLGSARLLRSAKLSDFCRVAFREMLVPRLFDDQHQGIVPEEGEKEDPLFLLPSTSAWIRSLFFSQKERELTLLPTSLFPEGRLTQIAAAGIGELDLEWSKFTLRRAVLRCTTSLPFSLHLPAELSSFRLRSSLHERGKRHQGRELLTLCEGTIYLFDQFHSSC